MKNLIIAFGAALLLFSCANSSGGNDQTVQDSSLIPNQPSLAQEVPPQQPDVTIQFPEGRDWTEKYVRETKIKTIDKSKEGGVYKNMVSATIKHTGQKPESDGNGVEHFEITQLSYEGSSPGGKMTYHSGQGKGVFDLFLNKNLRLTLHANSGAIVDIRNQENILVDMCSGYYKNTGLQLMKDWGNRYYEFLPIRPLKKGDTWETEVNTQWFPNALIHRKLTVDQIEKGRVKIVINGTVVPNPDYLIACIEKDKNALSPTGNESGFVIIDLATGIIVQRQLTLTAGGVMQIGDHKISTKIYGPAQDMEIEMVETSEVADL